MRIDRPCFLPAEILLPRVEEPEKWAVIACDQFTSQPEYWLQVRQTVGGAPSALKLILPEAELRGDQTERVAAIHREMEEYLRDGLFDVYEQAFVYVERRLRDGSVRPGLVGAVDLEAYDYREDADSPIRATERTVEERIPPRKQVRDGACLELPHVLLLCDDEKQLILEPLAEKKTQLPLLYDFELMAGGGRVSGWLVQGAEARRLETALAAYQERRSGGLAFAVGDGNHSLATAKACWEERKSTLPESEWAACPARYALVELENLDDPCHRIAPIHRIIRHTDVSALLRLAEERIGGTDGGTIRWCSGAQSGSLRLDASLGQLPVAVLQRFLDEYLAENPGEIDYIHGDETLVALAQEADALGFLLPAIAKSSLFKGISADGVLPRKTFSMGQAEEKRYYLEARKIL